MTPQAHATSKRVRGPRPGNEGPLYKRVRAWSPAYIFCPQFSCLDTPPIVFSQFHYWIAASPNGEEGGTRISDLQVYNIDIPFVFVLNSIEVNLEEFPVARGFTGDGGSRSAPHYTEARSRSS